MDRLAAMIHFVRVAEAGSFSAAARQLGLGQPALSKSVAQLEDRLGVRLFLRSTRQLVLTDAGAGFLEAARSAIDAADEAEASAQGATLTVAGRLRAAVPVTFARLHVVPRLPAFLAAHPGIELDLLMDDRSIDLVAEGVDVALRAGPLADSSLVAQRLGHMDRLVVATPDYWQRAGKPTCPDDLGAHRWILYAGADEWLFTRGGRTMLIRLRPLLRVSAGEGQRAALLAGMGPTIASRAMVADALAAGRVEAVLSDCALPGVDISVLFPGGRRVGARARLFADFLRDVVGGLQREGASPSTPAAAIE